MSIQNLALKTVDELRVLARKNGYTGAKMLSLKKPDLVHLIETGEYRDEIKKIEFSKSESSSNQTFDLAKIIAGAVQDHLKVNTIESVDEDRVKEIVRQVIKEESVDLETVRNLVEEALGSAIKTIEVKTPTGKMKEIGMQHEIFETVLDWVTEGENVWLYGEAGSGKTHLAESISKALDVPFFAQSVTSQTTKSDLFGYMDANGKYVPSHFYNAYKTGGVFCLDEVDNGNANVINLLNAATSNGHAFFPNGRVDKHKDFRLIACANTIGDGASRQYIGRNAIDAATKTRFVFLKMDTDWNLVKNLIEVNFGKKGIEYYNKCMKVRDSISSMRLTNIMLTSRTVFQGVKKYVQGKDFNQILDAVLFKGCDESTKQRLTNTI